MRSYDDFLAELIELKNEPVTPYRKATFLYWKTLISSYNFSLKYRKSKLKTFNTSVLENFHDKNLFEFFGSNDITDQEKKLKVLTGKLKEINSQH